jgi:aspartate ammonia-lyase
LHAYTGFRLRPAVNRFRVTQSMGDVLAWSGAVRRLAVEAGKIASDLRLLSMGPRAGLAEISLPAVQPGSSIMPGKVNPSVPEMVNQVCYQVRGCDATIEAAAEAGQLELNVMMPVIAWNAIQASKILANALDVLRIRTVQGLRADARRSRELLDRSTAVATALSPYIGYAATAEIAKEAVASGRSIRELVLERGLLPPAELDRILSIEAMTTPGVPGQGRRAHAKNTGVAGGGDGAGRPPRGKRAAAPRDKRGAGRAARTAVSPAAARRARRAGPRRLAAAGRSHGRAVDRRRRGGR